jgi:hypothetical protein
MSVGLNKVLLPKNRMQFVEFQIQLKKQKPTARDILQSIDPSAPIPQSLEGGNGNGVLYQCILDASKVSLLDKNIMYTDIYSIDLDKDLYRPDYYVQWRFGKHPTVSSTAW